VTYVDDSGDDWSSGADRDMHSKRPQRLKKNTVLAKRYRISEYLGHGSYGHVYAAKHLETGRKVCVCVWFR